MDIGGKSGPSPRTRAWLTLLVAGLVGALVFLLVVPGSPPLGPVKGDAALAREAAAALGHDEGYRAVSVARIQDGAVSWAGFGDVTPDSRFELGSITKTFDGLLLADAAARGEVRLDDRVDTHLTELAGTEVGAVTLEELASHRGGLPSLPEVNVARLLAEELAGAEYQVFRDATPESLIAQARSVELSERGTMAYSNFGAALLGFALVRAAGAPDWPTYVEERLFQPLGMQDTEVAEPGRPAPDVLPPHLVNGRPSAAWTGSGYAPVGLGVTSTAADMTRYAQAILAGTAPGMSSLEPRWEAAEGLGVGLAWMVADAGGRPVVWHNGATGGSRTMLAIDRERGTAAIVFATTSRDVTKAGLEMVGAGEGWPEGPPVGDTVIWVLLGAVTVIVFALGAVYARSRVGILGRVFAAAGALAVWWMAGPWEWAPPWTFGLAAGLAVGALVVSVRRWPGLPWLPDRRHGLALAGLVLGSMLLVVLGSFAAWVGLLRP